MDKRVLLFPGQGLQFLGMVDKYRKFDWCTEILARVDESLKFSLSKLMKEGPDTQLDMIEYASPAIMTASVLNWHFLREMYGVNTHDFSYALGHSLGEFTACVVSEAISIEDGVKLAYIRGKAMQEAVVGIPTRMTAVFASESLVRKALGEVNEQGVCQIAGVNNDKQVVLSGNRETVDKFSDYMKQAYKIPAKHINVSVAPHCSLMEPASVTVKNALETMEVSDSKIPVISNAKISPITKAEDLKTSLVEGMVKPTMFVKAIDLLVKQGCGVFTEMSAKPILSGILKKIIQDRKMMGLEVAEA